MWVLSPCHTESGCIMSCILGVLGQGSGELDQFAFRGECLFMINSTCDWYLKMKIDSVLNSSIEFFSRALVI